MLPLDGHPGLAAPGVGTASKSDGREGHGELQLSKRFTLFPGLRCLAYLTPFRDRQKEIFPNREQEMLEFS